MAERRGTLGASRDGGASAVLWFFDLLVRWPKSVTLRIGKVGVVIHFRRAR